jgi:uncharacterized protein (TIGR02588 family)
VSKEDKKDKQTHDQKNWLEWLVFSISLLLVLAILSYLVYQAYTHSPSDPDIYAQAKPDPSELAPNRYQVAIYNKGGSTAEEVHIEFTLYRAGEKVEKAELEIAFSPRDSKREGWITFTDSPHAADSVTARIVSYKKP